MNRTKRKIFVMLLSGILLGILYCMIFGFSAQDGETSGSLSKAITRFGVKLWDDITGGRMTQVMIENAAAYFEHPLRKAAHFCEYAVMGVLVFGFLYYPVQKTSFRYGIVVLWILVSAALDEFHQYFIPGRYASFADVLLDTCGGVCGALLCVWIVRRVKNKTKCF